MVRCGHLAWGGWSETRGAHLNVLAEVLIDPAGVAQVHHLGVQRRHGVLPRRELGRVPRIRARALLLRMMCVGRSESESDRERVRAWGAVQ